MTTFENYVTHMLWTNAVIIPCLFWGVYIAFIFSVCRWTESCSLFLFRDTCRIHSYQHILSINIRRRVTCYFFFIFFLLLILNFQFFLTCLLYSLLYNFMEDPVQIRYTCHPWQKSVTYLVFPEIPRFKFFLTGVHVLEMLMSIPDRNCYYNHFILAIMLHLCVTFTLCNVLCRNCRFLFLANIWNCKFSLCVCGSLKGDCLPYILPHIVSIHLKLTITPMLCKYVIYLFISWNSIIWNLDIFFKLQILGQHQLQLSPSGVVLRLHGIQTYLVISIFRW